MPAKGKLVERDYSGNEIAALTEGAAPLGVTLEEIKGTLGATSSDVYLNNSAYWRYIPRNVWEYTIGGYQVIKNGSHTAKANYYDAPCIYRKQTKSATPRGASPRFC